MKYKSDYEKLKNEHKKLLKEIVDVKKELKATVYYKDILLNEIKNLKEKIDKLKREKQESDLMVCELLRQKKEMCRNESNRYIK